MFLPSSDSPFLVLWYFYLLFLAAVVSLQLLFLVISGLIKWRLRAIIKRTAPPPTAKRKKAIRT